MIDPTALPMRYDELPELGDLGVRHAWNVWPNSLGTLNRITSESVLDALAIPRHGRRISLDLPLGSVDPPLYGRTQFTHRVFDRNRNMVEDELTASRRGDRGRRWQTGG